MLVAHHFKRSYRHAGSQRVTAIGGTVFARSDRQHDLIVCKDRRDRSDTSGQSLTQNQYVRMDVLIITGKQLTGPADTRLDLVGDKEDIMLPAEVIALTQIPFVGDDHAGLPLYRFQQETDHVRIVQRFFQSAYIIILNFDKTGRIRSEVRIRIGVRTHGDDRDRPSVEVLAANDDLRVFRSDPLHPVSPASCQFQSRFDSLGPGVHRQQFVIPEKLAGKLHILS